MHMRICVHVDTPLIVHLILNVCPNRTLAFLKKVRRPDTALNARDMIIRRSLSRYRDCLTLKQQQQLRIKLQIESGKVISIHSCLISDSNMPLTRFAGKRDTKYDIFVKQYMLEVS